LRAVLAATVTNAQAATVFTADFESGSTSGWSKSGGSWSVVADGSQTLRQTNAGSQNARDFAGDAGPTHQNAKSVLTVAGDPLPVPMAKAGLRSQ
jgi:hypothetical protein